MLKNKYDILLKEIRKVNKVAIPMLFKSFNMLISCIKMNDEKFDLNTLRMFSDMMPTIKAITNLMYELKKEIESIDKNTFHKYLNEEGINIEDFYNNFYRIYNMMLKMMLYFAIYEKENIELFDFKDIKNKLKLGMTIEEILKEPNELLSKNSSCVINKLNSYENFDYSILDDEEIDILEDYHSMYMSKFIYPNVTTEKIEKRKFMKLVKIFEKSKDK